LRKLAIINPQKFNFNKDRIAVFSSMLEEKTGAVVRVSLSKDDKERINRREGKKFDAVIAVGGDGTIYEVLNCIDLDNQVLGIIPKGTGNGFALDFKIGTPEQAVGIINGGIISEIDIIEAGYSVDDKRFKRLVISTAGVGYVEGVVSLGVRFFKPLKKLCYPIASVIMAFSDNSFSISSGFREGFFTNVIVNNTKHAGNFRAFPDASVNDGKLDVLIARNNAFQQIAFNVALLTGIFDYKRGEQILTEELGLILKAPLPLMLDGEIIKNANNITFKVLKKRLKCLI